MQIKPLFDRVLVIPQKQKQTTKSGLTFTLQEESNFLIGKVIALGDGETENGKIKMQVNIGDCVMFEDYSAIKIREENCTYYILKQNDILAKVGDEVCQN